MVQIEFFQLSVERGSFLSLMSFLSKTLPVEIRYSERQALNFLGSFIRDETELFIAAGGKNWAARSKIAEVYTSAPRKGKVVFRKKKWKFAQRGRAEDEGMLFLMKYFQWRIENEGVNQDLFVDFGGSSRAKVDYLITQVQIGAKIPVTAAMRRAFSFTEFPLKNKTTTIKIPPREIGKPVFRKTKKEYYTKFVDVFLPVLRESVYNAR